MADHEQKKISAEDKVAEKLGVLVAFLDPGLKARSEAKNPEAPWSARKALFFFLFASMISWLVLLGVIYLLFRII